MKSSPQKGQPLVVFHDVSLQIRNHRLFEHVNWSIRSDEHWAIVGPNGSGKSLIAKALYGGVAVVGGEIEYNLSGGRGRGADTACDRAPEDMIAHVSFEDQRNLIGTRSPYYQSRWNSTECEDVPIVMDWMGKGFSSGKKRRDIIEQLGIDSLLNRKITYLSNGEMRKVLIAEALLQSPLVLILDDPYVGLDYRSRGVLRKIIENLMKGAPRIVFITSRVHEIPSEITHMMVVKDGEVLTGKKETVLAKYRAGISHVTIKKRSRTRSQAPRTVSSLRGRPLIEVREASVTYDGKEVLKGINWAVEEGQNWALLGPNGSGKTTLLSLILADNPQAYSNDIYLFGKKRGSGESIWEVKKNIGWVSPDIQIHYQRNMTCIDVVRSGFFDSIGLYTQCSARQQRLASARLRNLHLHHLANNRFDELSSGQQRMVLIARALVKNPRLLILDEPCQGLDADNRRTVLDIVDEIGRRKTSSLIYVTHRLEEIPHSITHVLRLRNGRVVRKGIRQKVLGYQ